MDRTSGPGARESRPERAWVVHGPDGSDELTTTGPARVSELKDGKVSTYRGHARRTPDWPVRTLDDIKGGDSAFNAQGPTRHARWDTQRLPRLRGADRGRFADDRRQD